MTKDEALRLALEALENSVDLVREDAYNAEELYGNYPARQGKVRGLKVLADDHEKAITAIKAALEAKDEPVVWNEGVPAMLPKQKESETFIVSYEPKLEAKDEPVAWMRTSGTGSPVVTEELLVEMPEMRWNFQQPLYTTSPQRTWVGLTAEEREQVQAESYGKVPHHVALIAAVEAKLKEKNT